MATAPAEQRQPTLEEYAAGVQQANFDLQRQNRAFGHIRDICANMQALEQNPGRTPEGLPSIIVRIPTEEETPDQFELDLNTLPAATALALKPVFEMMAGVSGAKLQQAWARIHQLDNGAQEILRVANQAQVTQQVAPPAPQQVPQQPQ